MEKIKGPMKFELRMKGKGPGPETALNKYDV